MDQSTIDRIKAALKEAKHVVFLGGAGLSVASGIPDFRSPNGLYNKKRDDGMSYEELLSSDYFFRSPRGFYEFYWDEMVNFDAKPNKAHIALAEYERNHDLSILTQNIDGLHQKAGSQKVYEIHGSVQRYSCIRCGAHFSLDDIPHKGTPICPHCDGLIKPDVVLYGEGLPEEACYRGLQAVEQADVMIVGGTSLRVYPFASFPHYFKGTLSVLINNEKTPLDDEFDIVIYEDIGDSLELLLSE